MFRALLLSRDSGTVRPSVTDLPEEHLPEGDVLIDVAYSGLNYKDGLAVTDRGKIIRGEYPFVPGIDLAGEVISDDSATFAPGAGVILTGWGTGEERWGGFAETARAHPAHLVRLPDRLSLLQSMVLGTAGFTAMLAVLALEEHDVTPDRGEVIVTGASGAAGSTAVALLARLGYEVVASTGSLDAHDFLRSLGVSRIIHRDELGEGPARPMERARWAGAVDSVGGQTLASLIAQTQPHGSIASYGNAQSYELQTTVFPFILRGINLLGIDSNTCPMPRREQAWTRLREILTDEDLDVIHRVTIGLEEVPEWSDRITQGTTTGRVVVEPGRNA
jgi:acrylyl-CoA reductase (NADPH)